MLTHSTTNAARRLTEAQLTEAREWLKDIAYTFRDLEADQVNELTDAEVERAIARHYDGGLTEFQRSCAPSGAVVTFEAQGITESGRLLSYEVTLGRATAQAWHLEALRTLEDVARLMGYGLCLSASLHWHGGAFVTLESAEA